MPLLSSFYVQPKSLTKYVPRSTSEGVASSESPIQRRYGSTPSETLITAPQRSPDPPSQSAFFFDEQHRKWREREAKIQQETERARRSQLSARGDKVAPSDPAPLLYQSGGAHLPTSPLSPRFLESTPRPGVRDESPISYHERSATSRRLSSPSPCPRKHKSPRSNSMSMAHADHGLYGPPQPSQSYPYPVSGRTQATDNPGSSQTLLVASGMAASPPKHPTRSKRPPPLILHKNVSRQSSDSTAMLSPTSSFFPAKDLSCLNPFNKPKPEYYEPLDDGEETHADEIFGEPSCPRRTRRQSASYVLARRK